MKFVSIASRHVIIASWAWSRPFFATVPNIPVAHPCQQHMKFQPSKHKALLLLLLLLDIGLFLASTSTIIDRIPPKESLSASLAGGVHLTGGHFRWEKQILRALTNTTLPPPIPDTYSKISGARHENVVIRRKQRHTCDQILETTKIYQVSLSCILQHHLGN